MEMKGATQIFHTVLLALSFSSSSQASEPTSGNSSSTPNWDLVSGISLSEADSVKEMKQALVNLTNDDPELIPNWVQLAFHACVGGCDGCINLWDPDNKGLVETYQFIKSFHNDTYHAVISLADFVVVAATVAVEQGMRADGSVINDIPILLGRATCLNSTNPNKTAHLPSGNNPLAFQDLMKEFNITSKDAIALMGAHSLGRARVDNSGFDGNWDITEFTLDNGYFRSLHHTNWTRTEIEPGKYQWNSSRANDTRMMLPSDMYAIVDATSLLCQHAVTVSCKKTELYRQSRKYMTDQRQFHEDFQIAFSKMVANTQQGLWPPSL